MKYLIINTVCGIRSTGRICADIADSLVSRGETVRVAYGREGIPARCKDYAVRIGSDLDVKRHALSGRLFDGAGFGSRSATARFVEWVKSYDPDVIHLHNLHGYYINVEILFDYLKKCGKKLVWTLHDCWSFTGHCPYFEYVGCDRWLDGCGDCPQSMEYPSSLVDRSSRNFRRKLSAFTDVPNLTLVTPSSWLAELVGRSFLRDYPVEVINNGIDLGVFRPTESDIKARYGIADRRLVLGVASEWSHRKGLDHMVALLQRLGGDYAVAVIGVSEKQRRSLPQSVLAFERTSDAAELAAWYTAADVFANPTLEDNYPTTNLEAIACGTPVVTFDSGGSGESAAIHGEVVPKGDVDAMCDAIRRGIFERRVADISSGAMVERYVELYREITEGGEK